jgi:hypothetical protein
MAAFKLSEALERNLECFLSIWKLGCLLSIFVSREKKSQFPIYLEIGLSSIHFYSLGKKRASFLSIWKIVVISIPLEFFGKASFSFVKTGGGFPDR